MTSVGGRRWRRLLVAVYLVLLACSHAVRRWNGETPSPPSGLRATTVGVVGEESRPPSEIRLAWREWSPADEAPSPVLLLLHGSPGSSLDFVTLGPALGTRFRTLAPDLPGFGGSRERVPDYSIRAHARYVLELLDRQGVDRIHLVGFSMGGGVAIEMAGLAPDRVRSLTLLSAIGVQELELLGSYPLNHAVHGLQLGLLWLLHEAVPHFGLLDGGMLSVAYARNFYDSDQRPLREILSRLDAPTLILHGEDDILVPVEAAREHWRIVPQSELILFDASHFVVFRAGDTLAPPIVDFVERVESGRAADRADATAGRLEGAAAPFDPRVVPRATGITLMVMMGLLALATLVSEDLTSIGAGLLVAQGRIGFPPAVLACFAGILLGDVLLYWAGRWLGRPWLVRRPLRWFVSPETIEASSRWFRERGPAVILLSRFLPGMRLPTYFAAGLLHTSFRRFLAWFSLAVALWTPLLVGLAALVGSRLLAWFDLFERWALAGFLLALAALWLLSRLLALLLTHRGRRRLAGWWLRLRRWEFWPPWAVYPPVAAWVAWLGLKHRRLALFTAANPAIPAGGFIGESKAAILDGLPAEAVARYRRLPAHLTAERRLEEANAFAAENALSPPLVCKPDAGQRGVGVRVLRSWEEIESYLATAAGDLLIQDYVPGLEYGVFYVRLPGETRGRIFSITEKRLPEVSGDGHTTLEELVLQDGRAVAVASVYLEVLGERARSIPAPGERVRLTDLGTHCRGAIFLDGGRHCTAELEAAVDEISRSYEGFYFGRYDIRCPSEESFRAGRDLRVIELNGVTSEATHIYDPAHGLLYAWRVLMRQWALAFEAGRRNLERGIEPASTLDLLRMLLRYRRSRQV